MGTDIHTVIEKKFNGRWVGVSASDYMKKRPEYAERDYNFFAHIASVRGDGAHVPKGLPQDISELSWNLFSEHFTSHHSPSHMNLLEFCCAHNSVRPKESRDGQPVYDLTGIYMNDDDEFRVVFWFDS